MKTNFIFANVAQIAINMAGGFIMPKNRSVEEQVEDRGKQWLKSYGLSYFSKTENINSEIDAAMRQAPSKSGGSGGNYPDIRLLLSAESTKTYPIMIEAKGTRDKLVKMNASGEIDNTTKGGDPNYKNINGFAVNGAVHYAKAIIDFTEGYKEVMQGVLIMLQNLTEKSLWSLKSLSLLQSTKKSIFHLWKPAFASS